MNLSRYTVPSLGLMLVMGLGCQPNVQSIDRTQPNALHKSQFSGLYYTRATVVEADPESPAVQGITSDMDKIRWDISEEFLTAYRSYEYVPYAEGLNDEGRDFFGSMVAQYRILSHFDIQRDYNATTGRTGNIVEENTTDRPWYEREYIRVDWSTNRVGQQTRFWTGWVNYPDAYFSGISAASYYHQGHEETNIHRPVFTDGYFDVTNQYTLEPSVYYCIVNLFWQGVGRCGAANVRVRLSFNRVDPNDDYQPLYYPDVVYLRDDNGEAIVLNGDGRGCSQYTPTSCEYETYAMDAAFGNFRISRQAFDQERTFTNTGRLYVAGRFDIWQKSYDESGAVIPYANRDAKPVIYYSSVGFPDDLEGQVQSMADSWAKPFEEVVAFRKGYQGDNGLDLQRVRDDVGGRMFQVIKNTCNRETVKAYAEANGLEDVVTRIAGSVDTVHDGNLEQVCAAMQYAELQNGKTLDVKLAEREEGVELAFTWQRKGDLRHNMQNYIHPLSNGPWGVAQFGQDPETGEFVGANVANYFGDAGDAITQRGVDIIQWLNGDADEEALFRGELTRNSQVRRKALGSDRRVRGQVRDALMAHEGNLIEESGDSLFRLAPIDADERRMKQIFGGTDIEREFLVNDELLRGLAGPTLYQPSGAPTPEIGAGGAFGLANQPLPGQITGEALDMASPLNWGTNPMTNEFSRAARELGGSGFELASFFDPNMAGMAARYKGMERDAIWSDLRGVLFNAVQMHEVGHTVGLRHNFSSSMDPLNYQKNFWYEERPDGPPIERWAEGDPKPGNEMSIRNELKYASIMDYGFDLSLEGIHGIGEYDAAAIRFQYGQMVDYWDAGKISVPDPRKYGSFARRCGHNSDFWGVPALLNWLGPEHLPKVLSQGAVNQEACARNYDDDASCDSALDEIYREFVTRIEAVAAREDQPSNCTIFITEVNWLIEQVKGLQPNAAGVYGGRSFTTVEDMISQRIQVLDNVPEYDDPSTNNIDESTDGFDDDGDGIADDKGYDWSSYKYQVPYNYCSDFFAGFGVSCQRWDTGWDFLEATRYHVDRIDRDYIFDHFRRDAAANPFSSFERPRAYVARLQSRRLFHLTNVYRYYLYSRRSAFDADYLVDWAEAAYEGVNAMERMLQEVEPGTYCLGTDNVYRLKTSDTAQCNEEFETGLGYGGGRFLNSSWTNEYYYKANRIGYMYDKWAAIQQMTTSAGFFARDLSDLFDRRAFSLGYLRVYLDPIMQRWAALVEGTHEGYRPRVIPEIRPDDEQQVGANETGKYVRYMPFFDEEFEGGESVREYLTQFPEIEPAWSYDLSYWALAYGIGNWSGLYDYAPEFKNFAKVAIEGTPEDVDWQNRTIVEFTDPTSLLTYRAPIIAPFSAGGLIQEFPVYYGDAFHRARGEFRNWGIGANLLTRANTLMDDEYNPAELACTDGTTNVGAGQRWETQEDACASFEVARNQLQELVGYIDRVRKFVRRAEFPD